MVYASKALVALDYDGVGAVGLGLSYRQHGLVKGRGPEVRFEPWWFDLEAGLGEYN